MPNRGPVALSAAEVAVLLGNLPSPRDPKTAEDDEERLQIKYQTAARQRLEEANIAPEAEGNVVLSIEEVDALIDCLPPPSVDPAAAKLRPKLTELQRDIQENA